MCILFFIVNPNPLPHEYKLILASNRDEFYARPAVAAAEWKECEHVLGGRDMEPGREGGTWLAIGGKDNVIKVGALLNLTGEPKRLNSEGRGPIVSNFVCGELSNIQYTDKLIQHDNYNAYNLVSIEIRNEKTSIYHTSNAPLQNVSLPLNTPYGFGNSSLAIPLCKVINGKEKFRKILSESLSKDRLIESLMELLSCDEKFWPDPELKRRAPNWGEQLSRICVKMPEAGYGTRTNTLILVTADNQIEFYESTMSSSDIEGEWKKTHIVKKM